MNLFERLMYRRLCNEQPADGGAAPAASEPSPAPAAEQSEAAQQPAADPEPSPADGGKPEPTGDKPTPSAEPSVPEKYELTAPEGTELDSKAVELFEPVARELGLSNDRAQKLAGLWPQLQEQIQNRRAESWGSRLNSGQLTRRLTKKSVATN